MAVLDPQLLPDQLQAVFALHVVSVLRALHKNHWSLIWFCQ